MSEICKFPFADPARTSFTLENGSFVGSGELLASFTMINITDQAFLSDKKSQGWQVFVSNMPLDHGFYWFMFIKTGEKLKVRYPQNATILDNATFEMWYTRVNKPLVLGNLTNTRYLPLMNKLQYLKFGKIEGVELQDSIQTSEFSYNSLTRTLTLDEVQNVLKYFHGLGGVSLWWIKSGKVAKTSYSLASLVQPLISNDINFFKIEDLTEEQNFFINYKQGGTVLPYEETALKKLYINDKVYYLGQVTYSCEERTEPEQ